MFMRNIDYLGMIKGKSISAPWPPQKTHKSNKENKHIFLPIKLHFTLSKTKKTGIIPRQQNTGKGCLSRLRSGKSYM